MLREAKSEVRKHESRSDYFDSSVRDLQRDNLTPIFWKSIVPVKAMKNPEKRQLLEHSPHNNVAKTVARYFCPARASSVPALRAGKNARLSTDDVQSDESEKQCFHSCLTMTTAVTLGLETQTSSQHQMVLTPSGRLSHGAAITCVNDVSLKLLSAYAFYWMLPPLNLPAVAKHVRCCTCAQVCTGHFCRTHFSHAHSLSGSVVR